MLGGTSIVLLGLIPVLIWNSSHDWATIRHLLGHLGVRGGDTENTLGGPGKPYSIKWTLEYIALLILVGGAISSLAITGWIRTKKRATTQQHTAATVLMCMGLPVAAFYFAVTFWAQTEGNWPMSAFVTMVPVAAWCVKDAPGYNRYFVHALWGVVVGSTVVVLLFFPLGSWLSTRPVIGPMIPLDRATGMREHAAATQQAIDTLRQQTGLEPIIITDHYGRASQLAFYLRGHPTVYCNSALIGGRKTQYDLWDETNLANPDLVDSLRGRPGVLFGGDEQTWSLGFTHIVHLRKLQNESKTRKTTYTGLHFTGFGQWTSPLPIPEPTP